MTIRSWCGALTGVLLTCGVTAVAPAYAQNSALLPAEESGWVTVAGCLQPRGTDAGKYALASPMPAVASVTEERCNAPVDSRAFELDDPEESGITDALIGRWVEIYGKLERETSTDPDNHRELDVKSFRLVPVVRPRAEAVPAPAPIFEEPAAPPAETPVATSGVALPKTASPLTAIGLLGLLSLAGAFAFRMRLS